MTEKLGRRITPEEFQTWVHGRNTGDTLEYFFGRPFTQQEADEEEEAEETIYRALCRQSPDYKLADGLVEFLDFLAAHKIPRTIATASCGNNVRFFFDTLGLDRWFDLDKVIYNDGTLPGKPAPDLYLKAAQRLCVAPETCVIFEDSGAGIESAQRAGAKKVVGIASMKKARRAGNAGCGCSDWGLYGFGETGQNFGSIIFFKAIPHNSKCRYGERGAADAKPKAQIILDAAKVSAASGGNSEPKQGQRSQSAGALPPKHDAGTATRHYRAFWQRRCRAAAAGAVLKPQGGIVRCCLNCPLHSCFPDNQKWHVLHSCA